jgi:hypothetical protein
MTLWIGWIAVTILLFALVMGINRLADEIVYRRAVRRRLREL